MSILKLLHIILAYMTIFQDDSSAQYDNSSNTAAFVVITEQ